MGEPNEKVLPLVHGSEPRHYGQSKQGVIGESEDKPTPGDLLHINTNNGARQSHTLRLFCLFSLDELQFAIPWGEAGVSLNIYAYPIAFLQFGQFPALFVQ